MFDHLSFRAMEGSLSALRMKQDAILHNLANLETPGFKSKQVSFSDLLEQSRKKQGDGRYSFRASVATSEATEVRPDGNNVDADKENIELVDAYLQSVAIYQKINGQISDFRYVIGQSFK